MPLNESDVSENVDRKVVSEAIKFVSLLEAAGRTFDPKEKVPIGDQPGKYIDALRINFDASIDLNLYYFSISFELDEDNEVGEEPIVCLVVTEYYDEDKKCYFNWNYWAASGEYYYITPDFNYSSIINRITAIEEPKRADIAVEQRKASQFRHH